MAFMKKIIDKATFLLIVGIWTLLASYILQLAMLAPEQRTLIVAIGTLIISWLGIETGNTNGTPPPAQKPVTIPT